MRNHNLTKDEYIALVEIQNGICLICDKPLPDYGGNEKNACHIDHDHSCCPGKYSCGKCIRGILHNTCNRIVGIVEQNDIDPLNIVHYLAERRGAEMLDGE